MILQSDGLGRSYTLLTSPKGNFLTNLRRSPEKTIPDLVQIKVTTPPTAADDQVLFHLAVTKAWLRQFILALVLICHSPLRGVVELLRDLFGLKIALGTVHNVVHSAVEQVRQHNQQQDLSAVRIGAIKRASSASTRFLILSKTNLLIST